MPHITQDADPVVRMSQLMDSFRDAIIKSYKAGQDTIDIAFARATSDSGDPGMVIRINGAMHAFSLEEYELLIEAADNTAAKITDDIYRPMFQQFASALRGALARATAH